MIRMQIQFTDEQIRELKRLAADRGVSISSVDNVASSGYIQANEVNYGSGGATFNGTGTCSSSGTTTETGSLTPITTGEKLSLDE